MEAAIVLTIDYITQALKHCKHERNRLGYSFYRSQKDRVSRILSSLLAQNCALRNMKKLASFLKISLPSLK